MTALLIVINVIASLTLILFILPTPDAAAALDMFGGA